MEPIQRSKPPTAVTYAIRVPMILPAITRESRVLLSYSMHLFAENKGKEPLSSATSQKVIVTSSLKTRLLALQQLNL